MGRGEEEETAAPDDAPAAESEAVEETTPAGEASDATEGFDVTTADYDPEAERERFERRFGIDIGDRTVDEFLSHLDQQDYSSTPWFWSVVAIETVGITLFCLVVFTDLGLGVDSRLLFVGASLLLAAAIFADTRVVGLFERWAKIRWTYILLAAIPLVAHLAGLFYLVLRRLKHEQTIEHRQRLMSAGVDIDGSFSDD